MTQDGQSEEPTLDSLKTRALHSMRTRGVSQISFQVEVAHASRLVWLRRDGSELTVHDTAGESDGRFVRNALLMLSSASVEVDESPIAADANAGQMVEATAATPVKTKSPLAEALDNLVTTVVRLGVVDASESLGMNDGIARITELAGSPMPIPLSRWIGRLRVSLANKDLTKLARVLDGGSRLSGDLREIEDAAAQSRVKSWLAPLGADSNIERINDHVLVELGREWLTGLSRVSIQRRYLVDTESGKIFREERRRGDSATVGTCPREVSVGLAEVEKKGPAPRRIRLLQYEVSPTISPRSLKRLAEFAERDVDAVRARYREQMKAHPALSEPFALIAPTRVEETGVVGRDGQSLPIARVEDSAAADRFAQVSGEKMEWLAGRLIDAEGVIMIIPFAAMSGEDPSFVRFR